jgi:fumarylacetoacetate (FAA) hydrolase
LAIFTLKYCALKLVTHLYNNNEQLAMYHGGLLYNMEQLHPELPNTMGMFLNYWDEVIELAQRSHQAIVDGNISPAKALNYAGAKVLAPVPFPTSCRDGYAFRQHVETARRNRGLPMISAFDEFPVFYFTNHNSIAGPGPIGLMPDHFDRLDFELEAAIVVNRYGTNIKAEEADQFIAGLMIMNDLSARTLQLEEMQLNLGPAKGKDFCTVLGPWLVTLDELETFEIPAKPGHYGLNWNLGMRCAVNGVQVSAANLGDMDWTFAELIERASYGVMLHPGDVIGSGTCGTGCFLELNGTARLQDPDAPSQWLRPGDGVTLEIDGLGSLDNRFEAEATDWSLLARKKKG